MSSVFDVAKYILEKRSPMTAMKLEKITYYSQAWSLVWDSAPLFNEPIEAWMNGPVIPVLFNVHRGKFQVSKEDIEGNSNKLTDSQKETIDSVIHFYADKSAQWLSDLTHREQPWIEARNGIASNERGCNEITHASMHEYYSSIQ